MAGRELVPPSLKPTNLFMILTESLAYAKMAAHGHSKDWPAAQNVPANSNRNKSNKQSKLSLTLASAAKKYGYSVRTKQRRAEMREKDIERRNNLWFSMIQLKTKTALCQQPKPIASQVGFIIDLNLDYDS